VEGKVPHKDREERKRYMSQYRGKNAEFVKKLQTEYLRTHRAEARASSTEWRRLLSFQVKTYLGSRCACCGECEMEFLVVDHINNDGSEEARTSRGGRNNFYYYMEIRKAFESGDQEVINGVKARFQLLCWNCNASKHYGGGVCVHARVDTAKHPAYPYVNLIPVGC